MPELWFDGGEMVSTTEDGALMRKLSSMAGCGH